MVAALYRCLPCMVGEALGCMPYKIKQYASKLRLSRPVVDGMRYS